MKPRRWEVAETVSDRLLKPLTTTQKAASDVMVHINLAEELKFKYKL